MADLHRLRMLRLKYQPSELRIASEFLTNWLPFLSTDLCTHCSQTLSYRIRSLQHGIDVETNPSSLDETIAITCTNVGSHMNLNEDSCDNNPAKSLTNADCAISLGSLKDGSNGVSEPVSEPCTSRVCWADMAREDEVVEEGQNRINDGVVSVSDSIGEMKKLKITEKPKLTREQREQIRFLSVKRKKDFVCFEKFKGTMVNILEGLELHTGVFSAVEQKRIVNFVHELEELGRKGELKERTFTAPQKWMKGKGRVTIQFGCCYNYAVDIYGNPPGILQNECVNPIPDLLKVMIRRLVKWHVLPPGCVPDSCIVNIYDEGDCIPPHIDNHDFVRPFCTVSFVSECKIVFGLNLKILGPGEFEGSTAIPLPVGSVLVINGNAADVAKHCVPSVPTKRISITFRKMDEAKQPFGFVPAPDLQGIEPISYEVNNAKTLTSPKS